MEKEIKVGMKCKQVKAIEKYHFDYVGTEFEIIAVDDEVISIKNQMGAGGIDRKEFDTYFELIEEKPVIEEKKPIIKIGDKVKIIDGLFKNANLEGEVNYCSPFMYGTIRIKLSDGNIIAVSENDIEVIEAPKQVINKEKFNTELEYNDNKIEVEVKIRGLRTTVKLIDLGRKASVYCHYGDTYNREDGINRAFKKALLEELLKNIDRLNELIDKLLETKEELSNEIVK